MQVWIDRAYLHHVSIYSRQQGAVAWLHNFGSLTRESAIAAARGNVHTGSAELLTGTLGDFVRMPDSTAPRTTQPYDDALSSRSVFLLITATVLVIEIMFASGKELFGSIHFGLHGPGGYWAFQWPRDYSHGFVRRGLLGEMVRLVGLDNSNYLTVTLLSWMVTLLLYTVFAQSLRQLLNGVRGQEGFVSLIVLLLSPVTTGMFLEITGDPLQVVLLAYLVLHLIFAKGKLPAPFVFLCYLIFGVASVLIHEASLFFFAPALAVVCLVLAPKARATPLAGYLLGAVPAAFFVVLATQHGTESGALPSLHWRGITAFPGAGQYPNFSTLIAADNEANFGHGLLGLAKTGYRFVSCLILPVFLAAFSVRHRFGASRTSMRTAWLALLIPALCCLPLFLIAHDWGRFFSFELVLAIVHLGTWKPAVDPPGLPLTAPMIALACFIAGVSTTPAYLTYRVLGLSDSRPIYFAIMVATLTFFVLMRRTGPVAMDQGRLEEESIAARVTP